MQMKLAFIGDNDLPGVEADAKFAAEHGFEGLEYNYWGNLRDLTTDAVAQMKKIHAAHGVRVSMLGLWGVNHLDPDPKTRADAHALLHRAIDSAAALGADVFTTSAGDLPGEPVGTKIQEFMKVFPPFVERIRKAGMKPAFYALHGASFLDSLATCERVWEQMPEMRLKFDPANWLAHGDDYLEVLWKYGKRIGYMHIKEHLNRGSATISQPAAGMGDIAWGKVFAFLYEHDYHGWLSVEPHGAVWGRGELRRKMLLLTRKYLDQFLI
jgi:sugar phosphate isomerase/epimerase